MRKIALFLAVIIVITMPLNVSAASRAITVNPTLGFVLTTAECEATVVADYGTDYIEVTMKLMRGSSCVATWSDSGYGYVYMYEEASIARKVTYTLVVHVKVNNIELDPASVSGRSNW